eukprot:1970590-Rhodomonas_salina.1
MVQNTIKLVQCHLEGIPGDYKEPATLTYHVNAKEEDVNMDQDPVALQAHTAKKQKFLVRVVLLNTWKSLESSRVSDLLVLL